MNRRVLVRRLSLALAAAAVPLAELARCARGAASATALASARARLEALAKAKHVAFPFADPSIRIHKAKRTLELRAGDIVVKKLTVALGRSPEGPKRREGDMRTPEGDYFICYRNADSQFHLFLGLSYPNAADAAAARKAGMIDAATEKSLDAAAKAKQKPDWYTAMGGAVGIHGGGTGEDWTFGCIALSDEDVDELWLACPAGTPVKILP